MASEMEIESSNMHTTSTTSIILDRMPQQAKAQTQKDDWTGQSNQAERRRRQNRLNQRAYRQRKGTQSQRSTPMVQLPQYMISDHLTTTMGKAMELEHLLNYDTQTGPFEAFSTAVSSSVPQVVVLSQVAVLLKEDYEKSDRTLKQFQKWVSRNHMIGSPTTDQILVLVKFNIFRAMVNNALTLGFPIEMTMEDNALSPFTAKSKYENEFRAMLPVALRPTAIQLSIEHHPWIDLLPIPKMRDNIILAGDEYDDLLCEDLCGLFSDHESRTGMIIWGEPYDPAGWEFTPHFLRRWAWTLRGCDELMASTNYWRAKRGEKPLNFEGFEERILEIF